MNDIYPIKTGFLGFPFELWNAIFFLLFILILVLINEYFFKRARKEEEIIIKKIVVKEKIDFIKLLNQIENKYINSDPEIFYSHLSEIIRLILEEKENKNISKMTFDEINKLEINIKIKNLIKNIYFKEYAKTIDDNNEIRIEFIGEIKKLI